MFADSCLAQETLQRSKGDAKQSTLQRFAPSSKQTTTTAAPRQLRRSLTAAAGGNPPKQKHKARRSSSDSALLLSGGQQQQHAVGSSNDLDDDSEEVLPNRLLKQKPGTQHTSRGGCPTHTPVAARETRASTAAESDTTELQSAPLLPACVHVQTSIVGRRFRSNISCTRHTQVSLVRQPDNSRDSNAIQVVDAARQAVLGYLPKEIAQHLAGLLDAGDVQVTAAVDEPKSVAASVPVLLEVLHIYFTLSLEACLLSSSLPATFALLPSGLCGAHLLHRGSTCGTKQTSRTASTQDVTGRQTLFPGAFVCWACGMYHIRCPCHMQRQAMYNVMPPHPPPQPQTPLNTVVSLYPFLCQY